MALDKETFKTDLETWMNNKSTTLSTSVDAFADAYDNYAMTAEDVSGDTPDTLDKQGLKDVLLTLTTSETPATASVKFESAIIAYWLLGTFLLETPPEGTTTPEVSAEVTTNIIPGTLATTLAGIFTNTSDDVSTKAQQIADALDTATKTIIVTCIGTNGSPPPPTIAVQGTIT